MPQRFCLICGRGVDEVEKMHSFPTAVSRSHQWQRNMGMVISEKSMKGSLLCNNHFTNDSYVNLQTRRLKKDAVPTLFPCNAFVNLKSEIAGPSGLQVPVKARVMTTSDVLPAKSEEIENKVSTLHKPPPSPPPLPQDIPRSPNMTHPPRKSIFRGIPGMEKTPRKLRLMKLVQSKEAHIRKLKKICHKRKHDIKALSDLEDNEVTKKLFHGMPQSTINFLISQLRCSKREGTGRRWTLDEKTFALALMKRSPSGYNFLRKFVALPCKSTLLTLLSKIPFEVGINTHIFSHMEQCITTIKDKFVTLIFDEVDIKANVEYDKGHDRILGFEDLGPEESETLKLAKKALVFMVCGVGDTKWKQPVAYYFSHGGCTSSILTNKIKEVIRACRSVSNLVVVTTICDMGTPNVKAMTDLGATLEEPYIYIDGIRIFVMFDPPHLMKRTAALFRQYNVTLPVEIDGSESRMEARFEDVKLAYEKDLESPYKLRALYKIGNHHLDPKIKYTMKVNMATQLLSHTVASYVYTLTSANVLPPRAIATATFIQQVNDIFDSVNGSCPKESNEVGNQLRCQATAESQHMTFWDNAIKQVLSWQFQRKTRAGELKARPPSQKGWISTLRAMKGIWTFLQDNEFTSMRPRSFNQDPLENLFGVIRGGCGRADNPTVSQFIGSLKTQIINGLSTRPIGTNCEADEGSLLTNLHTFLLMGQQAEPKEEQPTIHTTTDVNQPVPAPMTPANLINVHEKIVQDVLTGQTAVFSVAYVAGFIVRNVVHGIGNCHGCLSALTGNPDEVHNLFIFNKMFSTTAIELVSPSVALTANVGMAVTLIENTLNDHASKRKISEYLILHVKATVDFTFIACEHHSHILIDEIVKSIVLISIPWWCKRKNRDIQDSKSQAKKVKKFKHA